MMDDLISRGEAIRAALRWYVNLGGGVFNAIKANIRSNLEQVPAVDAVPVVRCKDCKHSDAWYGDKRICRLWNDKDGHDVFEDGFCSYGERRESE